MTPKRREKALVFRKAKDRPVVITAMAAEATVPLTLNWPDFHGPPGGAREIYPPRGSLTGPRRSYRL